MTTVRSRSSRFLSNDSNHLWRFKFALLDQGHVSTVGKAVVLTDGEVGTVDEVHGLRISIMGHYGKWPS
jgi:hypothetical protein